MKYQFTKVNLISFLILIVMCFGLVVPLIVSNGFLIPNDTNLIPFDFINLIFLGIPSFLVVVAMKYSKNRENIIL